MTSLPFPFRVAVGLGVTAVHQFRQLPRQVLRFPMTAASQAIQVSFRVQQCITQLAIKGDDALSTLRSPEENPPWATFDEDQGAAPSEATSTPTTPADGSPAALPHYPQLNLPQLRARLRWLNAEQVAEILEYERDHAQRPEFVSMLERRLHRLTRTSTNRVPRYDPPTQTS